MAVGVAEHFNEQIGAAVDDFRRVVETRHRVDRAEQLDDEIDVVERTESVAHGSKEPEADEPGALVAFLNPDLGAELAGQRAPLLVARALAGEEQEVSEVAIASLGLNHNALYHLGCCACIDIVGGSGAIREV